MFASKISTWNKFVNFLATLEGTSSNHHKARIMEIKVSWCNQDCLSTQIIARYKIRPLKALR